MIDCDVKNALPVFKGAVITFVTWSTRKSPFHNDIFTPERTVTIATRRSENSNDGRSYRRGKMHRSGVSTDKQSCRFTQGDELFKRRGNLMDTMSGRSPETSNEVFFAWPPCDDHRMTFIHEPQRQIAEPFRFPTFRAPIAARINHDVVGQARQLLCHRPPSRFSRAKTDFRFPIRINPE